MNTLRPMYIAQILALGGITAYLLYLKAEKDKVEMPKEIAHKIDEAGIDISQKHNNNNHSAINFDNHNNENKKIHIKPDEQPVHKLLPVPQLLNIPHESIIYNHNFDNIFNKNKDKQYFQKHGYVQGSINSHNPRIKTFSQY